MPIRLRIFAAILALLAPTLARASFLSGDALDTMADWIAIIVLVLVPAGVIVVFWMIHVLPEKIAEKRHHPQKEAINTLCLLSLVFGGLLWPVAWIWAYTKPVAYRAAYGTDKHDDWFDHMAERARAGDLTEAEALQLRDELDHRAEGGRLPPALVRLRRELDELPTRAADATPAAAGAKGA